VAAPPTAAELVRNAAWLAGNLVRDEADELLPHAPAPTPPAAPAAPPPPPSPPVAAAVPPASAVVKAPPPPAGRPRVPIALSFFYPLATNRDAPDARTTLALNVVYGRVGVLDGIGLGTVNVVGERVNGMQVALAVNRAGAVDGLQPAPVNVAADVRGVQFGPVNVAKKVHGVQLGLVNVADDVSGVPIGLVSVSEAGGVHPTVWSSRTSLLNVGVKFATRYTYTQVSFSGTSEPAPAVQLPIVFGMVVAPSSTRMYGPGFALGFRVPVSRLMFESDLWAAYLFGGPLSGVSQREGFQDDMALDSLRALLSLEISRRFTLFAGAAVTAKTRFYQGNDTVTVTLVPDFFGGVQL